MANAGSRKKKETGSSDQMDLFEVRKTPRKTLRKGESRKYRSNKGHTYILQRVE